MKRIKIIAVFALLISLLTIGRVESKASKPQDTKVEQTLRKIEQELADELVKGGVSSFEKYLEDSYLFIGDDGAVVNRADFIALLKSGDLKYESSKIDQIKVRIYHDAAIMIFRTTDKGTYKNNDISGQLRWTDVFTKEGESWKLVSSHGTKIAVP